MSVLSTEGVVFTDIDDEHNRLAVGVEDLATQGPAVEAQQVDLGIPLQAVDIEHSEPVTFLLPESRGPEIPVGIAIGLAVVIVSVGLFVRRKIRTS